MWCKACSASDPTTDTVRVSFPPTGQQAAKELPSLQEEAEKKRKEEEERARRRAEEEETRRKAEAAAAAAAAAAADEERRRREAEEARRREEEDRKRKQAEAEAARQREEEARREELRRREEARQEQEKRQKQAADRAKVDAWLKKNGFSGATDKKKGMFSSSYPLHTAAKSNDAEMVSLLIGFGADPQAKNSSGQTAMQLAQKSDKKGSHTAVMRALGVGVGGA